MSLSPGLGTAAAAAGKWKAEEEDKEEGTAVVGLGTAASAIADSKAAGKNHPNFTVVIRKQVPFHLEQYSAAALGGHHRGGGAGSGGGEGDDHGHKAEEGKEGDGGLHLVASPSAAVSSSSSDDADPDFTLGSAWQFWELEDQPFLANSTSSGIARFEWNVRRLGSPLRTGRQFWEAYRALYQSFTSSSSGSGSNSGGTFSPKNLMLFRDSIEPKWEHPANVGGGRWFFDVSYSHRGLGNGGSGSGGGGLARREDILFSTNYWTQTMEAVISGALDADGDGDHREGDGQPPPLVVGLILNFKPLKYRVSLWLRGDGHPEKVKEKEEDFKEVVALGTRLRDLLSLRCQLKYEMHSTASDFHSK